MARFVSLVPPQTPVLLLVSVLLPRLQHRPSLVTLSGSITLLSTTLPLLLKTSRSSVASLRPSAKPISIAPTPWPMLHARVLPITTLTTRTDSHSLSVSVYLLYIFFLLYIFSYSGLILVLTCSLLCPYCYSRCGRLSSSSLSKGRLLYSFIFVHIPYIFIFRSQATFVLGVVRNDSLVRRLRRQRSNPCAVGR